MAQPGDVRGVHHAGIDVWQQRCLRHHQLAHGDQVVRSAGIAQSCQFFACGCIAQLGFVAEREQRLVAAGRLSGSGD